MAAKVAVAKPLRRREHYDVTKSEDRLTNTIWTKHRINPACGRAGLVRETKRQTSVGGAR